MLIKVQKRLPKNVTVPAYLNPDHVVSVESVPDELEVARIELVGGTHITITQPDGGLDALARLLGLDR
jgi:hypothetical protein